MKQVQVDKHEYIIKQGESGNDVYIVYKGAF